MARRRKSPGSSALADKTERLAFIRQRHRELVLRPRQRMAEDFAFDEEDIFEDEYVMEEQNLYNIYGAEPV